MFPLLVCTHYGMARTPDAKQVAHVMDPALPNAPDPQQQLSPAAPADRNAVYGPLAPKYAELIEPGQRAQPLSASGKMILSLRENSRPTTLLPALYSAGYEQLAGSKSEIRERFRRGGSEIRGGDAAFREYTFF